MSEGETEVRPFEYPAAGRARAGTLYRGAAGPGATRPVVVVVHGLFVSRALPEIELFCRRLAGPRDVVAIDMRGHGDGPGAFTWGREEHRDLSDLVAFLRALYPSVGVLGFSFGGDVAIFSAALAGPGRQEARPDAICTVGSPAHLEVWKYRLRPSGLVPHLRMVLGRPRRRFVPGWPRLRWMRAVDVVAAVSPIPLMILHGERDWLVHPDQAAQLHEAAGHPKEIRIIAGGLHAEYIIAQDPDLLLDPARAFFARTLGAPASTGPASGDVTLSRGIS